VSRLLAAALAAAERGWAVFPCRPGDKRPALHSESACPRTGPCAERHAKPEDRATTDPQRIQRCWAAGEFNVGLATGPSGLVVVDCDIPKPGTRPPREWDLPGVRDGQDVFAVLAERAGADLTEALTTYTVRTRHGGWHLYYRHPHLPDPNPNTSPDASPEHSRDAGSGGGGLRLRNTAGDRGGLGWCIDTRAWGGYVLAAGSVVAPDPGMPGPGRYDVIEDIPPAPLPAWLADRLTARPDPPAVDPQQAAAQLRQLYARVDRRSAYAAAALKGELDQVLHARHPDHGGAGRNHTLNAAAYRLGQLVGAGLLPEQLTELALEQAAAAHVGVKGFTAAEAAAAIRSGLRAGQRSPRHPPDPQPHHARPA
jgi:hypothetical protein